jgi:hypothetical protein
MGGYNMIHLSWHALVLFASDEANGQSESGFSH